MYEKSKLFKYILIFMGQSLAEKRSQEEFDKIAKKKAQKLARAQFASAGVISSDEDSEPSKPRATSGSGRPVAAPAKMKPRHYGVWFSLLLFVIVPAAIASWYMEVKAVDQYASTVGFIVREEEAPNPADLLGGLSGFSMGTASDTDILYEFIQSQQLVKSIDSTLDLYAIYSKPQDDPVFAFNPDLPIEDLVEYWGRMVKIYYDASTGLIELRVLAFTPEDAQNIANEIFLQSGKMVNELSDIAREDTTRYARSELTNAEERLRSARQAVTEFRSENMIVDPSADIQSQMGLLNTLQQQMAAAMIDLDLLEDVTRDSDPRIEQAKRKIQVIEGRINEERQKFGFGGEGNNSAYSVIFGQYEVLIVDREFAERSYFTTLATYNAAVIEAGHQSRYLAAYVAPTYAESSQFPERYTLLGLLTFFLFLVWAILVMIVYSIKDRR